MDKLTIESQEALAEAIRPATDTGNPQVKPLHLLTALLTQQGGVAMALLDAVGVNRGKVESHANATLAVLPTSEDSSMQQPGASRMLSHVISDTGKEATAPGDAYISTEYLLIAITASQNQVGEILQSTGAGREQLSTVLPNVRDSAKVISPNPEGTFRALEKYGTDLTTAARGDEMDPVINRDSEIHRVVQVLSRRTKNNPVFIGKPGMSKTAVVESLAQRIINGDVPRSLRSKRLIQLDVASMVAGARYRGEFEERFKAVLQGIKDSVGEIVTFIDEIHTVVGAGGGSESAIDVGNMLEPILTRDELRLIGATTLDEYHEGTEKDPALEQRFRQVYVGEPSVEDTVAILRGVTPEYEAHRKVTISDDALVVAAALSNRYIPECRLPDGVIGLVDEAASRLRMELDSPPEEIDAFQRQVDRLKMGEAYLIETEAKDNAAAADRLEKLRTELAGKSEELTALNVRWGSEKAGRNRVGELRVKLDELHTELKRAVREGRYESASRLQNGSIPTIKAEIAEAEAQELAEADADTGPVVAERVDADEIVEVISAWTDVPVGKLLQGGTERLLSMGDVLGKRLIGQKNAVASVSDTVHHSHTGVVDPNRPLDSSLFLGPTGVGKTESAKSLTEFIFDGDRAIMRIDVSEYSGRRSVSRLMGTPPGHVGYEEGGQLMGAVWYCPYSVILLDKVKKANPDVFDILLQVLDDGRLTDGQGRTVDFKNTILILVSNLDSWTLMGSTLDKSQKHEAAMASVWKAFKPEFINRLDDVIVFNPLGLEELGKIVGLQVEQVARRLKSRWIVLDVTDAAREFLAMDGYDPACGTCPLRRLIQREIGDKLVRMLLSDEATDGVTITVDTDLSDSTSGLELTARE